MAAAPHADNDAATDRDRASQQRIPFDDAMRNAQSHIAATDTVLEQQSNALTELEEKRVPALEEELDIEDRGTDSRA